MRLAAGWSHDERSAALDPTLLLENRPAVATGTALTPNGDDQLSLDPVNDGTARRWRAGAG